jgi:hypothetical protein
MKANFTSQYIILEPSRGRINYRRITYNLEDRIWENREGTYSSYREARLYSWRCDKCNTPLSNYKELKSHKIKYHSY